MTQSKFEKLTSQLAIALEILARNEAKSDRSKVTYVAKQDSKSVFCVRFSVEADFDGDSLGWESFIQRYNVNVIKIAKEIEKAFVGCVVCAISVSMTGKDICFELKGLGDRFSCSIILS